MGAIVWDKAIHRGGTGGVVSFLSLELKSPPLQSRRGGRGARIMPHRVLITFQLIIPIRVHSWRRKWIQHGAFLFVYLPARANWNGVNRARWSRLLVAFTQMHKAAVRFTCRSNERCSFGYTRGYVKPIMSTFVSLRHNEERDLWSGISTLTTKRRRAVRSSSGRCKFVLWDHTVGPFFLNWKMYASQEEMVLSPVLRLP